jgi:hypothetical protein
MSNLPSEETDNPLFADERNFYKVEKGQFKNTWGKA